MKKENDLPNVWNKAKNKNYLPKEGIIRWNSSNEKMYILKSKDGDYPCWEEIDPFEDLEERRVKK